MTDFNPRADTGIPTEPVGSLPRPATLQKAYAEYDAGNISKDDLETRAGRGGARTRSSAWRRRARRSSPTASSAGRRFATYPIADTLAGHRAWRRASGRAASSSRSSPTATAASCPSSTGGPLKYNFYAADTLAKSLPLRDQADEAGRHRAVDARAAVPAEGPGRRLHARGVRAGHRRRVRDRHPQGLRGRCRARLDRLHRGSPRDA